MAILDDITAFDEANLPLLQQILRSMQEDAANVKFVTETPTADNLATGEVAVKDDGSGVKTVYFRTPEGNITTLRDGFIENRTDDPASPVTGQIWLRTDL